MDYPPKKILELERQCVRLEKNEYYLPQYRPRKKDELGTRVYADLADGPKTRQQLSQRFGRSLHAIRSVGQQLRHAGLIKTVWYGDRSMWARTDMAVDFFPMRNAILYALKQGPMTLPMLVRKTDKKMGSIKSELHLHLVSKGEVIRTRYGVYALPGTAPQYVSNKDAICAALKNGPMTRQALASEVGSTPLLLQQFIDSLLAKGTIIRTKRGVYALAGTAPVYVTTSDAIMSGLTKKPMKMDALVRHVNRLTKSASPQAMIHSVLLRLKEHGTVKQDRRGGEYRLVRRACAVRGQAGQRRRS